MNKILYASFLVIASAACPLIAQTPSEAQFINSVNAAIESVSTGFGSASKPIVFSANLVYANGVAIAGVPQNVLLNYIDGLKAAGAQRIDINPGVTSINDPNVRRLYDAVVRHIRELGLQLAINPTVLFSELGPAPSFQDFENMALQTYPQLAERYQPDVFVVLHEPTTMQARMGGLHTTVGDWHDFILAAGPLIRAKSPRTRLGAGGFQNGNPQLASLSAMENAYFQDFAVNIPACGAVAPGAGCLDLMSLDIYNTDTLTSVPSTCPGCSSYVSWAKLAHGNGKGAYIAETWRPAYLPNPLPADAISRGGFLTKSLDELAILGAASPNFEDLNASWLEAMAKFAAANDLEAVTAFTTTVFFAYGSGGHDKNSDPTYSNSVRAVLESQTAQLTSAGQAFLSIAGPMGPKTAVTVSSASYATLPSIFNRGCGSAGNPCNANTTVAPEELVTAFGTNLATTTLVDGSFPTRLGGTTVNLIDSSNTSYAAPLFYVAPGQVSYHVPADVKPGPAAVTITSGDGTQSAGFVLVAPVAPGIYTATASGRGPAAAIAVCAGVCAGWPRQNGQFRQYTFAPGCTSANCEPQPLSVASGDTVVVELYGTGLRRRSALSAVTAQIDGRNAPVLYAGASGYTGEDQVNVQIPNALAGSGVVNLVLTVQDTVNNISTAANTVTVNIR